MMYNGISGDTSPNKPSKNWMREIGYWQKKRSINTRHFEETYQLVDQVDIVVKKIKWRGGRSWNVSRRKLVGISCRDCNHVCKMCPKADNKIAVAKEVRKVCCGCFNQRIIVECPIVWKVEDLCRRLGISLKTSLSWYADSFAIEYEFCDMVEYSDHDKERALAERWNRFKKMARLLVPEMMNGKTLGE